jgi:hypothetical protein
MGGGERKKEQGGGMRGRGRRRIMKGKNEGVWLKEKEERRGSRSSGVVEKMRGRETG